jgi:hypothetical protein
MNLALCDQILLIYSYCLELTSKQIEQVFNFKSCHTYADWKNYFNDICCIYVSENNNGKIGEEGFTVEIDETKIFKRKNHSGRLTNEEAKGEWVFGEICLETKETFFQFVENRSEDTLVQVLLKNVEQKTRIISDCWRAYNNISSHGYFHYTVNHSENFLSPEDSNIHTQTIERAWKGLKDNISKGSRYESRVRYLAQYNFKKRTNWYKLRRK